MRCLDQPFELTLLTTAPKEAAPRCGQITLGHRLSLKADVGIHTWPFYRATRSAPASWTANHLKHTSVVHRAPEPALGDIESSGSISVTPLPVSRNRGTERRS
jgi:hypothetical protein